VFLLWVSGPGRLLQLQRLGRCAVCRRQLQPEPEPRRVLPQRQQRRLEREREHRVPSPCQWTQAVRSLLR